MKNVQRAKFAVARGARIERHCSRWAPGYWEVCPASDITAIDALGEWTDHRIRPGDEHLQYGPLSTALRQGAIATVDPELLFSMTYQSGMNFVRALSPGFIALTEEDSVLLDFFKLFVAELLADEGL